MSVSDQTSLCPALIALRDKYRKLAIRTDERGIKKFGERKALMQPAALGGFMQRRDYYIYAAEAVGALTGVGEVMVPDRSDCAPPETDFGIPPPPRIQTETELKYNNIDTVSNGAVATEEK